LAHALRIIEHAGLAKPKIPTDIHRLLLPRA
jgi:hypothetical protein